MLPYVPNHLPPDNLNYQQLFKLVSSANAELARYDGLLQGIPNASVMLSPLTREEAVLSSRIEGTQATVGEVLEHEAGILRTGEKANDIQEIINYHNTLLSARDFLGDNPITLNLIRQLHKMLMNSVRGQNKSPGEFRTVQNWIGSYASTLETATFIPPDPTELIRHLSSWENYINMSDDEELLKTAIMHAQFELLHPFSDGNGRIGRILIPLYLYKQGKLSHPMFYLSSYLEANRDEYYGRLRGISQNNDWNGWIAFFLKAITEQAKSNNDKVKAILALYDEMKHTIQQITHSQYTVLLLDAIFDKPIFETIDFNKLADAPSSSMRKLLVKLKEAGVLSELRTASGNKPAVMCFPRLLNIVEGREVF